MARRRPMLDMLRPTMVIRAQAFRKGIFGSSRLWRAVALLIIGKRVLKHYLGREPQVVEVSTLKGGGHWMEIRTYGPETRRARRRKAS
jgi:hypothetical protein